MKGIPSASRSGMVAQVDEVEVSLRSMKYSSQFGFVRHTYSDGAIPLSLIVLPAPYVKAIAH